MIKIPTGIKKVDELLCGGVNIGSNVNIIGMPGSGKSLFTHKMIYDYLERGFNVLLVTTDRSPEVLMEETKNLGLNFKKYLNKGSFQIIDVYGTIAKLENSTHKVDIRDLTKFSLLVKKAEEKFDDTNIIKVFDVLGELFIWTKSKRMILQFISFTCSRTSKLKGLTFFVINDGVGDDDYVKNIQAITEGTIKLGYDDDDNRWLKIVKMRGGAVNTKKQFFKINRKNGNISFVK